MRVFVTGATGFVGSAVVQELLSNGHSVLGLARSESGAAALVAMGAEVHRGDLEDLPSLRAGAAQADGVIHTGFNHDFSKFAASCAHDRLVIQALGEALAGSNRPLIVTSGIGVLILDGALLTEATDPISGPKAHPRVATEQAVAELVASGINASVMRLPPSVHGDGDHGFVPMLIAMARQKGLSVYAGAGDNLWPAVHRLDAARLYRLALEKAVPARYHAVAEQGVPFREIAEVIGRRLGVPTVSKTPEEAAAHFGWFAHFAAMNVPASSDWTKAQLGWQPTGPALISDIDRLAYFAE